MAWYLDAWKQYFNFSGRALRSHYWFFVLFNVVISFVLGFVDGVLGMLTQGFGILGGIYTLAILIPSIAIGVRRLHDTGRTGWWMLIVFVPIVGFVILIVFFILEGTAGPNAYGPPASPPGATAPASA